MADCRKCKHNYKPSTCEPKCNRMCDGESDFEPITNYDRIQGMSIEELAEFLRKTIWNEGSDLFDCYGIGCDCACWKCDMYLKWLQSEAE